MSSNNNNATRTNGTQACAACKYQRRKCAPDCLLAPYFPHHLHLQFLNAHKLFGVSNITKIIRPLPPLQRDQAMRTIKFESDVRASDPIGGSCRIARDLQRQIEFACAELDLVLQQLAICRATAAESSPLIHQCQPDELQPQANDNVVMIHCDGMINNNVEDQPHPLLEMSNYMHENSKDEDHANNAAPVESYSLIQRRTQSQPQTQAGDDDDAVTIHCDSMINNNVEDQHYMRDLQHLHEKTEEDEDGGGIGGYFSRDNNNNNHNHHHHHNNNNVIVALQDMGMSWAMQDVLTCCLHDSQDFGNECEDLKPDVQVDIGGERLQLKYCNGDQIIQHSDEAISKKPILQEETVSCISKDEKHIFKEDITTIEETQDHDYKSTPTLFALTS